MHSPDAIYKFQHFDDLKRLGTLLAISLIFSGGCDLIHSFINWLRKLALVQKP